MDKKELLAAIDGDDFGEVSVAYLEDHHGARST